jgi:hypothetical protein
VCGCLCHTWLPWGLCQGERMPREAHVTNMYGDAMSVYRSELCFARHPRVSRHSGALLRNCRLTGREFLDFKEQYFCHISAPASFTHMILSTNGSWLGGQALFGAAGGASMKGVVSPPGHLYSATYVYEAVERAVPLSALVRLVSCCILYTI